jgi:hypothetical protein
MLINALGSPFRKNTATCKHQKECPNTNSNVDVCLVIAVRHLNAKYLFIISLFGGKILFGAAESNFGWEKMQAFGMFAIGFGDGE